MDQRSIYGVLGLCCISFYVEFLPSGQVIIKSSLLCSLIFNHSNYSTHMYADREEIFKMI